MAKKLFLGITLDKQQSKIIARLQNTLGATVKVIPTENLHMTIAFFGRVSAPKQQKLEAQLSAICKPKFSVTLNTLTYWRKPRVLCITGETTDSKLLQIVNETQLIAAALDLHKSEHTFSAHVTIARKAQNMPAPQPNFAPLIIIPCAIHLFHSRSGVDGVEYPIVRSWDLH